MKNSLNRRITIYFLIIMVLTAAVSVFWNYRTTQQSILEVEKEQAEGCADAITSLLDHYGEDLEKDPGSKEYTFLKNAVRNYCQALGQETIYLYSFEAQEDDRILLMVADSKERVAQPNRPVVGDVLFASSQMVDAEAVVASHNSDLERIIFRTKTGTSVLWISLYEGSGVSYPVFIGMEYSLDLENGHIIRDFLADTLLPVIALGVAFLVLGLMVRRRVVAPIRRISDSMKRFAHNSKELPEPLNINATDEIGEIAASFEAMTDEITTYISNIEELTRERVETNVQMDVARRIQYGLVPEKTTLNEADFCISAMTRPAKAVGGDFYDCFRREDGTVCFVMGDVSGKGVTGAIFMAMTKTIIKDQLLLGLSPAETLNQTNERLMHQNPEGLFATVFAGILDPRTGELRYANAGHTYPVILGQGATFLEPDPGIALGLFDDADIQDECMTLAPGQGMVLYTDGLTDTLNAEHVAFGMDRVLKTLEAAPRGLDPAEDVLRALCDAVNAFGAGVEPFDDTAVLVLFVTGSSPEEGMVSLPVGLSSFAAVKEAVFAQAGDTPTTRQALLACDEALANIVHYSGATKLQFACTREGDTLCIAFADDGVAFDPTAHSGEEKSFEELDGGGMGLSIIRQSVSSIHYDRKDGMNLLTLRIALQ